MNKKVQDTLHGLILGAIITLLFWLGAAYLMRQWWRAIRESEQPRKDEP